MSELNSRDFSVKQFRQFVENWSEDTRLDFKSEMYTLVATEQKTREQCEFEFAKDLVAFANVARRTGEPCYIVFGVRVKDGEDRQVKSVMGQFPKKNRPPSNTTTKDEQADYVLEPLRKTAEEWVSPCSPFLSLEHGIYEGKFVSWLRIEPSSDLQEPFSIKKSSKSGTIYVRQGSSCVVVPRELADQLLPASKADYLHLQHWQDLIGYHKLKGSNFHRAWMLPNFVELNTQDGKNAEQLIREAFADNKRIILVSAPAGAGKTVLLERLAYRFAEQHLTTVADRSFFGESTSPPRPDTVVQSVEELEVSARQPVPLFIGLRETFESASQFEGHITSLASQISGNLKIRSPQTLFAIPGSRWVLFLDGVDELGNREVFGGALQTWIKNTPPNVQVVLASRPYAVPMDFADVVVQLGQLSKTEIEEQLQRRLWQGDWPTIKNYLDMYPDLYVFLSRHRALDGLIKRSGTAHSEPIALSLARESDVPPVQLADPITPISYFEGAGDIPILKVESDELPGANAPTDGEDISFTPGLRLAEILRAMTDEMCEQEVVRRDKLGFSASRVAERAREALQRVAWNTDWRTSIFNPRQCEERRWWDRETRDWNEEIGFVERLQRGAYRFICDLFHCYMAAEYADSEEDAPIRETLNQRDDQHSATRNVITLLTNLRAMRGADFSL